MGSPALGTIGGVGSGSQTLSSLDEFLILCLSFSISQRPA